MPKDINKEEITTPKPVPPVILEKWQQDMDNCKIELNKILEKHGMTFKVNVLYQVDVIKK